MDDVQNGYKTVPKKDNMKTTREICAICGNVVRVGFWVPDDIWEEVVHHLRIHDIHCIECFTKRADEKLIKWDEEIKFYPISFASHLDPSFTPKFANNYIGKITGKMKEAGEFVDEYINTMSRPPTYDFVALRLNISRTAAYSRLRHYRDKMKTINK